jgi:hypothetical protein
LASNEKFFARPLQIGRRPLVCCYVFWRRRTEGTFVGIPTGEESRGTTAERRRLLKGRRPFTTGQQQRENDEYQKGEGISGLRDGKCRLIVCKKKTPRDLEGYSRSLLLPLIVRQNQTKEKLISTD